MIELPTLYALRQDDKIKQWAVRTEGDLVVMAYGILGKKQAVTKTRALPTNRGRTNERLGPAQAEFEAQAAWAKKKDEGFFETIGEAQTTKIILPMKAHNVYVERKRKGERIKEMRPLTFPMHVQRKLNGLRCLTTQDLMISRGGENWSIPHIQNHLRTLIPPGAYLDGEIYVHGMPLQTINSLIKDYRLPESLALQYHVYDMPCDNMEWADRFTHLTELMRSYTGSDIKLVETCLVNSIAEIKAIEKVAVEIEGYEGLILRQFDKPYRWNVRCDSLLKWKLFTDEEFVIIDVLKRELVKDSGSLWICDKFVCRNNLNEHSFEVVPRGTEVERAEYLTNKDLYIGKRLTVRFLERSMDGIPQGNPVGFFRLESDTPTEEESEDWA